MADDTLPKRLAEAREKARPLSQHVFDLELGMQAAIAAADFEEARRYQTELVPARDAAFVAEAHVTALQDAIDDLQRQRDEEHRRIQLEENAARDRARLESARQDEQNALALAEQHLATFLAGVAAVQQTLGQALSAESAAGDYRQEVEDISARLDNREAGRYGVGRPNRISAFVEQDQVLVKLMTWHR